jgi:hypothetical protein
MGVFLKIIRARAIFQVQAASADAGSVPFSSFALMPALLYDERGKMSFDGEQTIYI